MTGDLLWAMRWLRQTPLFTVTVTAILALGIGANTAVFSIVDAVLLRPLPYESSARLLRIEQTNMKQAVPGTPASEYVLWGTRGDLFEKKAAYRQDVVPVTGSGAPDQIRAMRVSAGLFSMLGVRAQVGRYLVESDGEPNSPATVV